MKDLRDILRSNSETTGGMKAVLVLAVYAILMRKVLRSAENQQQNTDDDADNHQDAVENRGDFKYDEVLRRIVSGNSTVCPLSLHRTVIWDFGISKGQRKQ